MMMRGMNEKDANTLASKCSMSDLTQFIAVSHHMPSKGVQAGRTWVHAGCVHPYKTYVGGALREYAEKTEVNYNYIVSHNNLR